MSAIQKNRHFYALLQLAKFLLADHGGALTCKSRDRKNGNRKIRRTSLQLYAATISWLLEARRPRVRTLPDTPHNKSQAQTVSAHERPLRSGTVRHLFARFHS
jgi:hypothetical protein